MLTTVIWLLFAAFLIGGGWLALEFIRAPYMPEQPTWEEHIATARAVLQPDDPTLPDVPRLSFIEQVEAYLAAHAPKES